MATCQISGQRCEDRLRSTCGDEIEDKLADYFRVRCADLFQGPTEWWSSLAQKLTEFDRMQHDKSTQNFLSPEACVL